MIRALRITGARYLACDKTGHVFAAAGRVLIAALAFHAHFAGQNHFIQFPKSCAMAGGMLQVAAFGSGRAGSGRARQALSGPRLLPKGKRRPDCSGRRLSVYSFCGDQKLTVASNPKVRGALKLP